MITNAINIHQRLIMVFGGSLTQDSEVKLSHAWQVMKVTIFVSKNAKQLFPHSMHNKEHGIGLVKIFLQRKWSK